MIRIMNATMDDSVVAFSKEKFIEVLTPIFGKHTEKAYYELHGTTSNNTKESTKEVESDTTEERTDDSESVQIKRGKRKDN